MKEKDNMKEKAKRPIYEPPRARDLTAFTVDGKLCFAGGIVDGVGCDTGSSADACASGGTP